jgi:hypothetical protein
MLTKEICALVAFGSSPRVTPMIAVMNSQIHMPRAP